MTTFMRQTRQNVNRWLVTSNPLRRMEKANPEVRPQRGEQKREEARSERR
jgi:hypothetical protein